MIEDIRFFKGQVYKLKMSNITSLEIEKQLGYITYTGEGKPKDSKVENSNIPYFSMAFFNYIFQNDKIPNEEEFFDAYIEINEIKEDSGSLMINGEPYSKEGVMNRMLRSYPSLIRDFHFYKTCQESKRFDKVQYSTKLDILEGVDLLIEHKKLKFCIAIYVETRRGLQFKKTKNEKRHDYAKCRAQIELPIDLSTTSEKIKMVSNFMLLSNDYISELEDKINIHVGSNR